MADRIYDVAIIGGSFAGLSAALLLANSRREVIVIDNAQPRNLNATISHNFLGHEGDSPNMLLEKAHQQLHTFTNLTQMTSHIDQTHIKNNMFLLHSDTNDRIQAKKLILATGVYDILPNIPNIKKFWIKNIFHCPYCIAPDLIDQPLAAYSTSEEAFEPALIIHKWSRDFTLLTDNSKALSMEQEQHLANLNIKIFKHGISQINQGKNDMVDIEFANQNILNRRGIFMHLPFKQKAESLIKQLGCEINNDNLIATDAFFQTAIPGLYAIGDTSQSVQKISTAIASGTVAGYAIDHALSVEQSAN